MDSHRYHYPQQNSATSKRQSSGRKKSKGTGMANSSEQSEHKKVKALYSQLQEKSSELTSLLDRLR